MILKHSRFETIKRAYLIITIAGSLFIYNNINYPQPCKLLFVVYSSNRSLASALGVSASRIARILMIFLEEFRKDSNVKVKLRRLQLL